MAKMPAEVAKATAEAETGYALMEEGDYVFELAKVQTTDKQGNEMAGPSGNAYWKLVFQIPEDAERYKKRMEWVTFSFSDGAASIRKGITDALGVTADSDSDTWVGRKLIGHIVTISDDYQTEKTGEQQFKNEISRFMPLEKGAKPGASKGVAASKAKASADNF